MLQPLMGFIVEIMKAMLPEESQEEIPVGFSIVGHIG
jgi:hypothetical protein